MYYRIFKTSFTIAFSLILIVFFALSCQSKDNEMATSEESNVISSIMRTKHMALNDTTINLPTLGIEVIVPKGFSFSIQSHDSTLFLFNKNNFAITSICIKPVFSEYDPNNLFINNLSQFSNKDSLAFLNNKEVYFKNDLNIISSKIKISNEFDTHRDLLAILNKNNRNYYFYATCSESYWVQDSIPINKIFNSISF